LAAMSLSYEQFRRYLGDRRLPLAMVDLDAFDRNLARVLRTLEGHPARLRIATKSLRVVELLRRLERGAGARFGGFMCYALEEAAHLFDHGFDDLLVAYPIYQASDLALASDLVRRGCKMTLMVDAAPTVARLDEAASAGDVVLSLVICVDMALELAAGRVHLGVRRSPLRTPAEVVRLARDIASRPLLRFAGIMGYEAQVAGLGDANPFAPALNGLKALIRRASVSEVRTRRRAIVTALGEAGLPPGIVNGGGSGSLDSTPEEAVITEVAAGSAFLKPHSFDYYKSRTMRDLEPAAFFALEVTRQPSAGMVTCLGGGYVASGPPGADKIPLPWRPEGLSLLSNEMCGEVQTPLDARGCSTPLGVGDPVVFRHAKAGELAERFNRYLLLQGGEIVDTVPTYRGQGRCFF
jgi:D-serine deaminase-like pyridoxal phosphate-dependent protein